MDSLTAIEAPAINSPRRAFHRFEYEARFFCVHSLLAAFFPRVMSRSVVMNGGIGFTRDEIIQAVFFVE